MNSCSRVSPEVDFENCAYRDSFTNETILLPLFAMIDFSNQDSLSCNARSSYNGDKCLCPLGKAVADADADRKLFLVALKENFCCFDCNSFFCDPAHS